MEQQNGNVDDNVQDVSFNQRVVEYKLAIEDYVKTKPVDRLMNSGNRRAILQFLRIHDACNRILERESELSEEVTIRLGKIPSEVRAEYNLGHGEADQE